MKIGIDIRSILKKTLTGIGTYTINLIDALAEFDTKNSYYLYSRKNFLDFKRHLPKLPAGNFFHCVDYFKRGPDSLLSDVDMFHTSSYDLDKPKRAKYIVTIHDVVVKAYPFGHSKQTIEQLDEQLKRILNEADILIADSYNTKTDLMKFYGVPESKVTVIYPGVVLNSACADTRSEVCSGYEDETLKGKFRLGTQPLGCSEYILFVGTLEPRKNIQGLIKAFNWLKKEFKIKHKLYITGMKGWMYENIFKAYEESGLKKEIVFTGYRKGQPLRNLYQNASVFVYPSFYEGFGFPIVEAFSFGVPVVTSKTSACGEIAGESALLIDPNNYEEIGEAILKLVNDETLRKELSQKGMNRAREFSRTKTASEFFKLFTQGRV